jgi:hypothetical protein
MVLPRSLAWGVVFTSYYFSVSSPFLGKDGKPVKKRVPKSTPPRTFEEKVDLAAQVGVLMENTGMGYKEAEKTLQTVGSYKILNNSSPDIALSLEESRKKLVDRFDDLVWQIVGLLPEKLKQASAGTLVEALDKLIKNQQLLKGQPTEITAQSQEERMHRIREILLKSPQVRDRLAEQLGLKDAE